MVVASTDVIDDGRVLMFLEAFYDVVILTGEHLAEETFHTGEVGTAVFVEKFLGKGDLLEIIGRERLGFLNCFRG